MEVEKLESNGISLDFVAISNSLALKMVAP